MRSTAKWVALLVPLVAAAIVYLPITRGYFFGDDFLHLYRRVNDPLLTFLLHPSGGHVLIGWNVAIALTHAVFGTWAAGYLWLVLLAHLVAVALLYLTAWRLTTSAWIAALVALSWGTAPMQLGTLGWLSVSGQVMAAVLLLIVLADMAAVADGRPLSAGRVWAWAAALLYGATCFGVGLAVAMVAPFAAWLMLAPRDRRRGFLGLVPLIAAVPLIYVLDHWLWARLTQFPAERAVDALRIITVPRVAEMMAILVTQGLAGLLGGPPAGRWQPLAMMVFPAATTIAGLAAVAKGSPSERRRVAGLMLFALAAYGAIALGRADLFANLFKVKGADLVGAATDRYQYLASAPLALALGSIAALLVRRVRAPAWSGPLAVGVFVLWTAAAHRDVEYARRAAALAGRTNAIVANMGRTIMAAPPGGVAVIGNRGFGPAGAGLPAPAFPGLAGAFVVYFPKNEVAGRRVVFVDRRPQVLEATKRGRRTAGLIVPVPPPVPPG